MHRWIRTLLATTLTLTFLAAAARLGWVAQPVSAVPQQPFAAVNPPGGSATDAAVQRLQQRLGARPDDPSAAEAYAQLGNLYLQKARETGDPSYYTRADGVLKRSLELDGDNVAAIVGVGGLHLARHSFAEALQWGERAVQLAPASHAAHGVVGDAAIELGRYQEGMAAVQIMVDLRPGLSSYSRVSYVRELVGDQLGAIAAMESALDAGPPGAEGTNWSRVQLGHLYFASGDLKSAERQYQTALRLLPNYAPAVAGLGRV
ncbi:MAG: tetratricopeptide repeat protein, partial [Chloroflexota bacterium]|nr:tetratricopeptide repeat protein [Chloroflexota bacterium]